MSSTRQPTAARKRVQSKARKAHAVAPKPAARIVLVGDATPVRPVSRALESLKTRIERVPWSARLAHDLHGPIVAVVLVAPLPLVPLRVAVGRLRTAEALLSVPIFAVVPGDVSEPKIRRIYQNGAAAVFLWPREALVLPRCLAEMIAMAQVRGRATEPDKALARTVRAHLKLVRGLQHGIRVEVRDGMAVLSGHVNYLWKKQRAEETVARVPGIKGVIAHELWVDHSGDTDRRVRSRVVRLLEDTSGIDESTLAVSVDQGSVTLSGSVEDRQEFNRVVDLIAHVRGVRSIDKLAVVSAKQKEQDNRVARRLRKLLSVRFGDYDLALSFFGFTTVLAGRVPTLQLRREVERAVADDDQVQRVVNKIEVR